MPLPYLILTGLNNIFINETHFSELKIFLLIIITPSFRFSQYLLKLDSVCWALQLGSLDIYACRTSLVLCCADCNYQNSGVEEGNRLFIISVDQGVASELLKNMISHNSNFRYIEHIHPQCMHRGVIAVSRKKETAKESFLSLIYLFLSCLL